MKKKFISFIVACFLLLSFASETSITAIAAGKYISGYSYGQLEDGTYELNAIFDNHPIGHYNMPSEISGYAITAIGDRCFEYCEEMTGITIPETVTSIGNHAFYSCESLEQVYIQGVIEDIGSFAFSGCDLLEGIHMTSNFGSEYFSVDGVLYGDFGKTLICCPAGKKGTVEILNGVERIEDLAFSGCKNITHISIPNTVTSIGKYSFSGCTQITQIELPYGITEIPSNAFSYCYALKQFIVPETVFTIGESAFYGNYSLESAYIPQSVREINARAFLVPADSSDTPIPGLVVTCNTGSAALSYCTRYGIEYTVVGLPDDNVPPTTGSVHDFERIHGNSRIETSVEISRKGWERSTTVILANAYSYPDALAGGSLAGALSAPILLTEGKERIENSVLSEMRRLGATKVYILGGESVISEEFYRSLINANMGFDVSRIYGSNRYSTAVAIAKERDRLIGKNSDEIYFVSANNFPDALAISPVAAIKGNPILFISNKGKLDGITSEYLLQSGCKKAVIIGGESAVSSLGESALKKLGMGVTRISGKDRCETALKISEKYSSCFWGTNAILTTGTNYPDALSGGAFAAQVGAPMLLVSETAASNVGNWISRNVSGDIFVLGGINAVKTRTLSKLLGRDISEPQYSESISAENKLSGKYHIGDTFYFGKYEQDDNLSNGPERIEWRVLAVESDKMLVISEKILDCAVYHTALVDVTWETCSLRAMLNNEFYNNAFSSSEKEKIRSISLTNRNNTSLGGIGGNDTVDKVFCLSVDEANMYCRRYLTAKVTPYADSAGVFVYHGSDSGDGSGSWWLRSPGEGNKRAVQIGTHTGSIINTLGYEVNSDNYHGIRPAIYINI